LSIRQPLYEVRLATKAIGGPPFDKELSYWIKINQKLELVEKVPPKDPEFPTENETVN
jgi:hypothetical protein